MAKKKEKKGKGGNVDKGRSDSFSIDTSYELFTLDESGNLRTPESQEAPHTFIFPGAIENFTGRLSDNDGFFGFDVINITDEAAFSDELTTVFYPLTLDLTARYLTEGSLITLPNGENAINVFASDSDFKVENGGRIEYIFTNEILENIGINEVTLILKDGDRDGTNGFQIDEDQNKEGFQVRGKTVPIEEATIDIEDAISDIEYIVDNGLLRLNNDVNNDIRVSGVSSRDFNQIVSIEDGLDVQDFSSFPLIIEAEDLVRDVKSDVSNYSIEKYANGDEGDELISLRGGTKDAAGNITGEVKFKPEDFGTDSEIRSLTISTFDEDDGASTIEVYVGDVLIDGTVTLNETIKTPENPGNDLPNETIRVEYVFDLTSEIDGEITGVGPEDEITIRGMADDNEWARIDYIILEEIPEF